jgi:hypothetical protein
MGRMAMALEDQVATLVARNASLFAAYENFSNGQTALVVGSRNDPDSFDRYGLKNGPLGYYPVLNASGELVFVPCVDRVRADAEAATADAAAGANNSRQQAEAAADRAQTASESAGITANAYDSYVVGLGATAEGALFSVFQPDKSIKTFRKVSGIGVEVSAIESTPAAQLARQRQGSQIAGTPRVAAAHVVGGMMVLVEDDLGALFYLDALRGRVYLHNLQLDGGEGLIANGRIPLMRAQGGQPMLSFDLFDRRIVADYGEVLGTPPTPDFDFLRVTEWDEAGQPLAGYEPGQRIRLHPQVLDGLSIQGDHNKVPQLWALVDSPKGPTRMKRQLTFSQYGVTGFQVIQRPDGAKPGLIRISCNDTDPIRDRHKVRHAHWHVSEPATAAPTKIVYIVVIGQSNSVAAGSYGTNPTGITGPQTIRTAMPIRKAAFASRLLTWNGGTIPYQGNLDGDAIVGGVEASTIPIDAARIASFVPMREGLGQDGADVKGGWTRESFITALATHLNGPNGYDGSG